MHTQESPGHSEGHASSTNCQFPQLSDDLISNWDSIPASRMYPLSSKHWTLKDLAGMKRLPEQQGVALAFWYTAVPLPKAKFSCVTFSSIWFKGGAVNSRQADSGFWHVLNWRCMGNAMKQNSQQAEQDTELWILISWCNYWGKRKSFRHCPQSSLPFLIPSPTTQWSSTQSVNKAYWSHMRATLSFQN